MAVVGTHIQTGFFLILLLAILALSFLIFQPYLSPIVLAATFAVVFYPLYQRLLKYVRSQNLAALIAVVCVVFVIGVPLAFFGGRIFQEALAVYEAGAWRSLAQDKLTAYLPVSIDVNSYIQRGLVWVLQHTGQVVSRLATIFLYAFIGILALFYFFRDGEHIIKKLKILSPLQDRYDTSVIARLQGAINSVVRGALLIAIIQGILTGVGLALFGVPNAVLWGSIAVIAALIPYLGTAAVLTPAIVYLFVTNQVAGSIGLLIWGIVAVGLIDNFLGPRLVNRGIRLHPIVILLAVLGGLAFFGPLGYLLGPLTISLLFALLDIYPLLLRAKADYT